MNFSHQKYLFDPKRAKPVVLFGAGSVGSYVAFFLAKKGIGEIEVWDGDYVASHNLPMSLYRVQDEGRPKVSCLQAIVREHSGAELVVHEAMYDGSKPFRKNASVIACVDSMDARKTIWERVKRNPSVDVFIDTRTSGSYVEVLVISPMDSRDVKRYEALLFEDKDAVKQNCGVHGIVEASAYAASVVSASLTQRWAGVKSEWRVIQKCDTLQRAI